MVALPESETRLDCKKVVASVHFIAVFSILYRHITSKMSSTPPGDAGLHFVIVDGSLAQKHDTDDQAKIQTREI